MSTPTTLRYDLPVPPLDFGGYYRLAARAMLQAAMELEAVEFVGRAIYERRRPAQAAYRNGLRCSNLVFFPSSPMPRSLNIALSRCSRPKF